MLHVSKMSLSSAEKHHLDVHLQRTPAAGFVLHKGKTSLYDLERLEVVSCFIYQRRSEWSQAHLLRVLPCSHVVTEPKSSSRTNTRLAYAALIPDRLFLKSHNSFSSCTPSFHMLAAEISVQCLFTSFCMILTLKFYLFWINPPLFISPNSFSPLKKKNLTRLYLPDVTQIIFFPSLFVLFTCFLCFFTSHWYLLMQEYCLGDSHRSVLVKCH